MFYPETSKRHFRLIIADPLEQHIVPKLLRKVGNNSQISFELQPPQLLTVEDSLISGKTDLAVFLMHGKNSELTSKTLCPVDLVVLFRRNHPRMQETVTLPQLSAEGFVTISLSPGKLANSEKVTFWQRLHLKEVCQVYKVSSIGQLVSQSDLLGIVPRIYAEQIASSHQLQIANLPFDLSNQQFHLIWHNRTESDDGLIWLRKQISSCFSQDEL